MLDQSQSLADTLPKLLLGYYKKFGHSKVALREKTRGIWVKYTWADYYSIVRHLATAFLELGIHKYEKVAIIGETKPHVYWYELAALACGGQVLGIFPDSSPSEMKYFLSHSESTFVVCQGQEQVDKILKIKDECPYLKRVIYWELKGMWSYEHPLLITMDEMIKIGKKCVEKDPDLFEKMIKGTKADDAAIFLYSSGTKDLPKAAVHSHWGILKLVDMLDRIVSARETDQTVSFLPLALIGEQLLNLAYSLFKGFTVNFPERHETVRENIREVGPHFIFLSPSLWEAFIKTIRVKIENAGFLRRFCFETALKVGYRIGDARMLGKKADLLMRLVNILSDKVVFRPLRDRLGFSRTRTGIVFGATVNSDVIRYFHAIGVPLLQAYGSVESPIITIHSKNLIKPGSSGQALRGSELKISEEGEILIKSPFLFQEYYKDPEETVKVIKEGWYYTGDYGRINEDGQLIVIDRMDALQQIKGDKRFSPQYSEIRLRSSPYIKNCVVLGHVERDYASAIINIDYDSVGRWAEANGIAYATFTDLRQNQGVISLLKKEIETVNKYLCESAVIKKFIILHKEFDPDEGELTRDHKLRRDFVRDKYDNLVEALFGNEEKIDFTTSISYQDGTKAELKSLLSINRI